MLGALSREMDYWYTSTAPKRKACREYIKNDGTTNVLKLLMPDASDLNNIFEIRGDRIIVKIDLFAALKDYPTELVIPDFVTEVR